MRGLGGNKPKSNAGRLAFADMKEYLDSERIRLHSEFTYNEPRVVCGNHVMTVESRYLNRLLGLDKTEGLMKWYKTDPNSKPVKKVGYVAGLRNEIERLRKENRVLQLQLAK